MAQVAGHDSPGGLRSPLLTGREPACSLDSGPRHDRCNAHARIGVIGAPDFDHCFVDEGRAFVYLGSAAGLASSPAWTADGNQDSASFGVSVASAGDVNGDGYSDVIVGANDYDNGQTGEGRVFVYLGSAAGLAASPAWTAESNQAYSDFGYSVASAGDVNGDGYGDVIVGAYQFDNAQSSEGRAFVYLGNHGGRGWTQAVQQRRSIDAAPIALLGASSSQRDFRLRLCFDHGLVGFQWASPLRPKARLEWEVVGLGGRFTGVARESGTVQDMLAPVVFNERARFPPSHMPGSAGPGGASERIYKWRARLRTNNPLFPVTPWVSIPGDSVTELKLRALEEDAPSQR